jgi:hypothetical protein
VGPTDGLDVVERRKNILLLPAIEPPFLGCPARCLANIGLSYTGYPSIKFFFFSPTNF